MVNINTKEKKLIDFSFMLSLKCNLSCGFCMYEAGPNNNSKLDLEKTTAFILGIDFDKINAFGFYGGEISSDYDTYQKFINLVPDNIPKFTITNGSWSTDTSASEKFINFVKRNKLNVFISNTQFHKPFQDKKLLDYYSNLYGFVLKEEDIVISMGRAGKGDYKCSKKCEGYKNPIRLALHPPGEVMFCNCNGVYPIVGTYDDNFYDIVKNSQNPENFCKKLKEEKIEEMKNGKRIYT